MGTATRWEVSYNNRYGAPGRLAYKIDTLVINRRIDEAEKPIGEFLRIGSLKEIANELSNKEDSNRADTNRIKKALLQNASTFINAKISYTTKDGHKKDLEIGGTRYTVVFTGDSLPNGGKADCVYLILNKFYREVINQAQVRPLDYSYMKSLPPMAQRFYEIISYVIYGVLKNGNKNCKMRYSEFCKLSTATRYYEFDQVKKQMYKVHRPHVESGYIEFGITYQPTIETETGNIDWWIFYTAGPNAGKMHEEFTTVRRQRLKSVEIQNGQRLLPFIEDIPSVPPQTKNHDGINNLAPEVKSLVDGIVKAKTDKGAKETKLSPETQALVSELLRAGVNADSVEHLAINYPAQCRTQLDYLPYHPKRDNPGGWLIRAIPKDFPPPSGYIEAQEKKTQEEQKRKAEELRASRERATKARQEAEAALLDSEILTLEDEAPEEFAQFLEFIEAQKAEALNKPYLRTANRAREIMAQSFATPEKRRELFTAWRKSQN